MSSRIPFSVFALLSILISSACAPPTQEVIEEAVQTALVATQESIATSTSLPPASKTPVPFETFTPTSTPQATNTPIFTSIPQPTETSIPTNTPDPTTALVGKWVEITGTGYFFELEDNGQGTITTNEGTFAIEWQVLDGAFCGNSSNGGLLCNEYWLMGDTLKLNDLVYLRQQD